MDSDKYAPLVDAGRISDQQACEMKVLEKSHKGNFVHQGTESDRGNITSEVFIDKNHPGIEVRAFHDGKGVTLKGGTEQVVINPNPLDTGHLTSMLDPKGTMSIIKNGEPDMLFTPPSAKHKMIDAETSKCGKLSSTLNLKV